MGTSGPGLAGRHDFSLAPRRLRAGYLRGVPATNTVASPSMAKLAGPPPLLIQVVRQELLLDIAQERHRRATQAGVLAQLVVWDDMSHVWHLFHSMSPEGERTLAR